MLIGVPKEIKTHEYRVGLVPSSVRELVLRGHQVTVETGAGAGIGIADDAYPAAGAQIAATPEDIFALAEMVVKVKEPQAGRDTACCARTRSCSPTCTSRPTCRRPKGCSSRAASPSPTRP